MSEGTPKDTPRALTKEERLAAKLRENLRRRKSQSRQMRDLDEADLPKSPDES